MTESWYRNGLKFSCKKCSACCRYDAGYVYLTEIDLKRLIAELKIDKEQFIGLYCRWVGFLGSEILSLKERANRDCVFWKDGCTVYDSRPNQCRTFPFWNNILVSENGWNMAAEGCPGMNFGKLHLNDEIDSLLENTEDIIEKRNYIKAGD